MALGVLGVAVLLVLAMAAWALAGGRIGQDPADVAAGQRPGSDDQWSTWPAARTASQAYATGRDRAEHHQEAPPCPPTAESASPTPPCSRSFWS